MEKILISCPIQNREWILSHYLRHIKEIDYPKELISLYFIINNSNDNSHNIIIDFKQHNKEYNNIYIDVKNNNNLAKGFDCLENHNRSANIRSKHTYSWLSELRNNILDKSSEIGTDYLLSLDSDILVKPDIIKTLLSHKKEILAGLIWNGYLAYPTKPYQTPNILKRVNNGYKHVSNFYTKNPNKTEKGKNVEVDFTGAVFLISKKVFDNKNVRFNFHKQGEDGAFCEAAQKEGFKLFCALDSFSYHIMSKHYLDLYLQDKNLLTNY